MKLVKKLIGFLIVFVLLFVGWMIMQLGSLASLLPHYTSLAGGPFSEKTYLVVLQNNAEMRPTGGFISSYAEVHFKNGLFKNIEVHDVFSLQGHDDDVYVEPPYPMAELLAGDMYKGHSFHDANWFPDFARSSEELLNFYSQEFPSKNIDGVIAINYSFIEALIGLYGPFELRDHLVSKTNAFHVIQYEQNNIDRHSEEDLAERKSILSELLPKLLKSVFTRPDRLRLLSTSLEEALDSKDIQVYLKNDAMMDIMKERGWSGSFSAPANNELPLAVIEANLGGMKSDRYLSRHYTQHYEFIVGNAVSTDNAIRVTTTLEFKHLGDYNAPLSHEYRGYIRTYAPKTAQIDKSDSYDLYEEDDFTVIGQLLSIAPGESKTLSYSYLLPLETIDQTFIASVFKQSGLEHTTYAVEVKTPTDFFVVSDALQTTENLARITITDPTADLSLPFTLQTDQTPPRITVHEFVDYNRIMVQFNEPVLPYDCTNPENYQVNDTNTKVPDVSNVPTIREVRCSEREAIIYTRNIRSQYDERFTLTVRNIRDYSNNIISPNPMEVTVIQRFEADEPN